jgi:hypothetical protein
MAALGHVRTEDVCSVVYRHIGLLVENTQVLPCFCKCLHGGTANNGSS